ncbi:hypothetical protein TPHA_0H00880 [Tetrapisispora phaffii CBS 4417]|uniref:NAD(P)H-hydrate epimerase n=1 Tax=Tetrapisispora phaffii (strain ATCC 24235 / CBS 4417 / NBRC 1672 / NRRL Y-8282 / UCD 70-5) TaxID=1071381 RepID=G8BWZ2_TETPH|nr:hypothetical protein TPHA_0H00880 [Tetrapisispora phaffii CBS 4417]CCE64296.1 hypothetical protein TPHA_0H00880 [Tetrapisispora phaffii CBS 4417]
MSNLFTLSSKLAAQLDQELMGPKVGFTLQQLMELAGFSVAQAVQKEYAIDDLNKNKKVLVIAGPGNNGGDGLVCARHLKLFGYNPVVYYPKRSSRTEFYGQLVKQLDFFNIPILEESDDWLQYLKPEQTICIIDAIFGFSFKSPMREPFGKIVDEVSKIDNTIPVVAVDVPSGWDVDEGPTSETYITPSLLVSLTVPKPCSKHIDTAKTSHYVGGRFIPNHFAEKYGFKTFKYQSTEQVMKL